MDVGNSTLRLGRRYPRCHYSNRILLRSFRAQCRLRGAIDPSTASGACEGDRAVGDLGLPNGGWRSVAETLPPFRHCREPAAASQRGGNRIASRTALVQSARPGQIAGQGAPRADIEDMRLHRSFPPAFSAAAFIAGSHSDTREAVKRVPIEIRAERKAPRRGRGHAAGTVSLLTQRWRKPDSNHRSLVTRPRFQDRLMSPVR